MWNSILIILHFHCHAIKNKNRNHSIPPSSPEAPAGYPNKNSNNGKIESARGTMGRGKRRKSLLSFPNPSPSVRFLSLPPQPPYDTKRPLRRREIQYRQFRIREMKEDKYAKRLAKKQVCATFYMQDTRKNVLPKFINLCVKTPCWCLFEGIKYGGRKPTETSLFQFLYTSKNSSLEELIKKKVKIQYRKFRIREMKVGKYAITPCQESGLCDISYARYPNL